MARNPQNLKSATISDFELCRFEGVNCTFDFDYIPILDAQNLCVEMVDVLEALLVSDRIDEQEGIPFSHVLLTHRTELLLAGCVQH